MKKTFKQITNELKKMDEIISSVNGISQRVYIQVCGNGIDDEFDGNIENVIRDIKIEYTAYFVELIMKAVFDGSDTSYIEDADGFKYSITIYLHQ